MENSALLVNCTCFFFQEYKPRLQTFSFKNCAPSSKEIGVVNSLSFMPDPLSFPGPLQVAFDLTIKSTLDAPLKVGNSLLWLLFYSLIVNTNNGRIVMVFMRDKLTAIKAFIKIS